MPFEGQWNVSVGKDACDQSDDLSLLPKTNMMEVGTDSLVVLRLLHTPTPHTQI